MEERVGDRDDSGVIEMGEFCYGRFRGEDGGYFAARRLQGFVEEVEAFGYREAVVCKFVARDGSAHFAEQRIGCAGNRLSALHPVQC